MKKDEYGVRLTAKNEGVEYYDGVNTYRFDVSLSGRVWTLFLPGSHGDSYELRELDLNKKNKILPRVIEYLENIKWLGLFRISYSVEVVERPLRK